MVLKRKLVGVVAVVAALGAGTTSASAATNRFGRTCAPQDGVRFCGGSLDTRVPTWDGVPLDVDVTLPPSGDGPFPTLVMLHGWGGNKGSFEKTGEPGEDKYDNLWFAKKGYAVVNYSARGWGNSCGSSTSRAHPGCAKGWLHLADQRFEVRDTQYLVGLLVDQGVTLPTAIGVTGVSYGGGQSMQLAFLNDKVREGNTVIPWTSPNGTPLSIAAAWPRWPWSSLASSLAPNGRYLDFVGPTLEGDYKPVGVPKSSYTSGLYALGNTSGFIAPPGLDPTADLTTWFAETNRGEPETESQRQIVRELHNNHSAEGLGGWHPKAPLLIQSGWTDDLFPVTEGLKAYQGTFPAKVPVWLQAGDLGHARGQNKQKTDDVFQTQGTTFFDALVARNGAQLAKSGTVTAMTQTCPMSADPGGPFTADNWAELHPGAVITTDPTEKTITSDGGDPQVALTIDPIGGSGACAQVDDADAPGTANYRIDVTQPFTLLGMPTVQATIDTTGAGGQIASRLWDIAPDGKQVLVARGIYRLDDDQKGPVTFQLFGNGYRFETGHSAKLELLGRDAPYVRASNERFSVKVTNLKFELPVNEKPGTGQVVVPQLGDGGGRVMFASVHPRSVTVGKRYKFRIEVFGGDCKGCPGGPIAGAKVVFGGKRYKTNKKGEVVVKRKFRKPGNFKVRAGLKGYPTAIYPYKVKAKKKKRSR